MRQGSCHRQFRESSSGGRVWFLKKDGLEETRKKLEAVTAHHMYSSGSTRQVRKMELWFYSRPRSPWLRSPEANTVSHCFSFFLFFSFFMI